MLIKLIANFILLIVSFLASGAYGIDPIIIKGSKFFYQSNGTEFIIKGVRYEAPGLTDRKAGDLASFIDPLTDPALCKQDIPYLLNLGVNTLYVSGYNANRNQKACMQQLSDAGLYVLVVINVQSEILEPFNGTITYEDGYVNVNHMIRAGEFFRKWNNTLGLALWLGTFINYADVPPVVLPLNKRYIGDLKDYMRDRSYRSIPIGVVGGESYASKGFDIPKYMSCGEDSTVSDFYITWPLCRDMENWCLNASAHYGNLRDNFQDYQRPLILAEGCRQGKSSNQEWVRELYSGPGMAAPFSGAIFLNWLDRPDVVEVDDNLDCPPDLIPKGLVKNDNGANITTNEAYAALSAQFASVQPTPAQLSASPPQVPILCEDLTLLKGGKKANVTRDMTIKQILPAKTSEKLCKCMMRTLLCVTNQDSSLESQTDRIRGLLSHCNRTLPIQPKECVGIRISGDLGMFDSYIHCNTTERYSWAYNQYSNSSDICRSIDGIVSVPTPTASLDNNCQLLLRQAGVSGLGTVTSFPTGETKEQSSKPSRDISTGTKVGVSIAISLLILFGIGGCIVYHRRNKPGTEGKSAEILEHQKPELADNNVSSLTRLGVQLDSEDIYEMDGSSPISLELDGRGAVAEVAGDFGATELESKANAIPNMRSEKE